MRVEVISQVELGSVSRVRVGDVLNQGIASTTFNQFRFAVAYMRMSGLDRISASIDSLVNRSGRVAGAVGIDDGITTLEAVSALQAVSGRSTIFHTVSGYIFHPKLYLLNGEKQALALIGSPNLTRDGLFRNVELASAVHLDFASSDDFEVYQRYDAVMSEFLDPAHPNVQLITDDLLTKLVAIGAIQSEKSSRDPGPGIVEKSPKKKPPAGLDAIFPPLSVPVAPPIGPSGRGVVEPRPSRPPSVIVPPTTVGNQQTFMMQFSSFDSSHRTGVGGTPEVLIPHPAVSFFPPISKTDRKYPDVLFDVVLNTSTGRERHEYRLWYYDVRAKSLTSIDEYRLRMDHDTIDLSTLGGGDLLVISKLPAGSNPQYEVTVLPQTDPTFPAFFSLCTNDAQGKKWGLV